MMQIITLAVIAAVLVAMVVTGKILRWRPCGCNAFQCARRTEVPPIPDPPGWEEQWTLTVHRSKSGLWSVVGSMHSGLLTIDRDLAAALARVPFAWAELKQAEKDGLIELPAQPPQQTAQSDATAPQPDRQPSVDDAASRCDQPGTGRD